MAEQKEILVYLHSSVHRLNGLKVAGDRFVALLKERRTALISAAVTGKIDVRNIAMDNTDEDTTKQEAISA
ncbi:MAG: hypothetical protein L3J88_08630 [Gammaproteobacteria bacterium]|nr:hypothetical protein [Gammaproteobacteria bacterium]